MAGPPLSPQRSVRAPPGSPLGVAPLDPNILLAFTADFLISPEQSVEGKYECYKPGSLLLLRPVMSQC